MERYITAEEVMNNIRTYRKALSYDDQFDFDMETKRIKLSNKCRAKLSSTMRASEHRMNRYGIHKDKIK